MAVKAPKMRDGYYMGEMTDAQADSILKIIGMESFPQLKDKLWDFPAELVVRSMEEEKSIRSIIKEENIDYKQYQGGLRDKQSVGAAFMLVSPRSILGDGVGAGKTAQISAVLNVLKASNRLTRFLMCVEANAVMQTIVELTRFTGMYVVEMPTTTKKTEKCITETDWNRVDGVVMAHSGLKSDLFSMWMSRYIDENGMSKIFNTFILDESSVIKNKGTKTFDYTENICNIVPRVHFLNATTFETSILDVYNQVDMMNPNVLPNLWKIQKEFCTYKSVSFWKTDSITRKPMQQFRRQHSGYKNQEKFKQLLKLFYFGRPREESKHKYRVVEVVPTPHMGLWIARGARYSEVLNCPSLVDGMGIDNSAENVPKLAKLTEMAREEYAGKSIMVYCFHTEAQAAIASELEKIGRKPVILNGSTPQGSRADIQKAFNDGVYDVIITNVQKSLNLAGGDVCIIYSQIGNPAKMEQVRGRIDRNVDDKQREFVLMLYKGTDEYKFFVETAAQRAMDSRALTIDAKTAVDYFMESLNN